MDRVRLICILAVLALVGRVSPVYGQMPGPAVDSTYFSTQTDLYSEAVRANANFHFIKVIDRRQITLLNAQTLNDLLRYHLYCASYYLGAEGYNFDFMQTGRRNVRILLNGQPYWQASIDQIDLSNLLLVNVDRVEILYGASSVIHGSNAVLAVINVVSRNPDHEVVDLHLNGISSAAGEYNFNGEIKVNRPRHHLALRAGRYFHYGDQGADSGRVYEWKPVRKFTVGSEYRYLILPKLYADVSVNYLNSLMKDHAYPFQGTTRVTDRDINQEIFAGGISLNGKLSKYHRLSFQHNYTSFWQRIDRFEKILDTEQQRISLAEETGDNLHYDQYWSSLTMRRNNRELRTNYLVGMTYTHQRDRERSGEALKSRSAIFSGFGQVTYQVNPTFMLLSGLRLSRSNGFRTPPAFELKSTYFMNRNTSFRVSYSHAYRIPTFNELFFTYEDPELNIKGNRNLASETYSHLNTLLSINSKHVRFNSNMMWLNTSNGIQLILIDYPSRTYSFRNTRNSRIMTQGIDLELEFGNWSGNFGLTNTGINQFPDAIDNYYFSQEIAMSAMYSWDASGWTLASFMKWNSSRNELRLNTDEELEDYQLSAYSVWDLSVAKEFKGSGLLLSFGLKNLLDVQRVSGGYLPIDRFSNEEFNKKVPVNIDFGRRVWMSLQYNL
ncbi:MAG: TonB-dependent receptor [Flavobacteriales bacterium]|nr:TonB-dependent receptor [Flavobacteriales bacterium]